MVFIIFIYTHTNTHSALFQKGLKAPAYACAYVCFWMDGWMDMSDRSFG